MTARLYLLPVPGHIHIYPNDAYLRQLWAPLASAMANPDTYEQVASALAELGAAMESAAHVTEAKGEPFALTREQATLRVTNATNALSDLVGLPEPLRLSAGISGQTYQLQRELDRVEALAIDLREQTLPPTGVPF